MIAVIDYGGGNVGSLLSALQRRGATFELTGEAERVRAADGAILPGDGAFAATMAALETRGLADAVRAVLAAERPFFGICVGMQLLFESSDEYGATRGFGAFAGAVAKFSCAPRTPHMGWNDLELVREHPFVEGLRGGEYAYFLHSYRAPVTEDTLAACTYGERFAAVVARGAVVATQFHPEKSQRTGAVLLDNFVRLAARAEAAR